jgi:CTP synthase
VQFDLDNLIKAGTSGKMDTSRKNKTKYIFITGGVVSSIGKGLAAASIGALLETRGLLVGMTKMDPYINVDPGTMSPFQHGEVFVTDDGAETDLDLGHYQRFTKAQLGRKNSFTTGQVYDAVITKERKGEYLGGTVQVIPHITDQIKENVRKSAEGVDVAIVEVGGTIGDIESLPFLEAIRQFRIDVGKENALFVHITLVPYIKAAGELKTKPTQHSVKELRSIGLQPDILICRADQPMDQDVRDKISLFCNLERDSVFESLDLDNIYRMPLIYHEQGLDARIVDALGIWTRQPDLRGWQEIIDRLDKPKHVIRVGVVGKYLGVRDSYKSLYEALTHGGIAHEARIEVVGIDAEQITQATAPQMLRGLHGLVVPGGFGNRGIQGKINAIQFARESKLPFLGICLGMQLASIEFARNVLGIAGATSEEFDKDAPEQVIHLMEHQLKVTRLGGSMRLGAWPCVVKHQTRTFAAYGVEKISERHRHRYEFQSSYRKQFEERGMIFSGMSPDDSLVEIIELADHPWFVACQFHPELKSRPTGVHPLFRDFIGASLSHARTQ